MKFACSQHRAFCFKSKETPALLGDSFLWGRCLVFLLQEIVSTFIFYIYFLPCSYETWSIDVDFSPNLDIFIF